MSCLYQAGKLPSHHRSGSACRFMGKRELAVVLLFRISEHLNSVKVLSNNISDWANVSIMIYMNISQNSVYLIFLKIVYIWY